MAKVTAEELQVAAAAMLGDLERERLEVTLAAVPGYRRRKIRVATQTNPEWYSRLCWDHSYVRRRGRRRPDTLIKRAHVARVLELIASGAGPDRAPVYWDRVLPYVEEEAIRYRKEYGS